MIFDPKPLFDEINRKNQVNLCLKMVQIAHDVQPLKLSSKTASEKFSHLGTLNSLNYDVIPGRR
jgi:hypothetical protein